jgi:hypothetical protein
MSAQSGFSLKRLIREGIEVVQRGMAGAVQSSLDMAQDVLLNVLYISEHTFDEEGNLLPRATSDASLDGNVITFAGRRLNFIEAKESLSREIDRLNDEADMLAQEFRGLFRQASEAFESEERALAKSLSEQGKEAQARCEDLNRQANQLRQQRRRLGELVRVLSYREHSGGERTRPTQTNFVRPRAVSHSKSNNFPERRINRSQATRPQSQTKIPEKVVSRKREKVPKPTVAREQVQSQTPDHLLFNLDPNNDENRRQWAHLIVEHSFDGHKLRDKNAGYREFPGYMRTKEEMRKVVSGILRKPTRMKRLKDNRIAYFDKKTDAVIILNLNMPDRSTFFQPAVFQEEKKQWEFGMDYFNSVT